MLNIVARISDQQVVETTSREITQGLLEAYATNYADGDVNNIIYYTATSQEEDRVNNGDEYSLVWSGDTITGLDFSVEDSKYWLSVEKSAPGIKADAPADISISNISIFNDGDTYNQDDLVFHNNAIFKCVVSSTTETPSTGTDWDRVCSALTIKFSILRPDKSGVVTAFNDTAIIDVAGNVGSNPMRCQFTSGECTKVIIMKNNSDCGDWIFPLRDKRDNVRNLDNGTVYSVRINNQENIKVILPF